MDLSDVRAVYRSLKFLEVQCVFVRLSFSRILQTYFIIFPWISVFVRTLDKITKIIFNLNTKTGCHYEYPVPYVDVVQNHARSQKWQAVV